MEASEEDKRLEFNLFQYANYCGLVLGIFGASVIELFLLFIREGKFTLNNLAIGLIIVCLGSLVLYYIIQKRAYDLIGVSESRVYIYNFEPSTDNLYKVAKYFVEQYKESNLNKDSSSEYNYNEKLNEKYWDSNKQEAEIVISHSKRELYDIYITIKDNSILITRPTTNFAKAYLDRLSKFILNELRDESILKDINFIREYSINEE